MAITSYSTTRTGNVTTVTVISDLSGTVYYHWYLDGTYVARTTSASRAFHLEAGDQVRIEVNDTTDPDYDPIANAPAGYPARRSLWWVRSLDGDVDYYRVEQRLGAGSWESIGIAHHDPARWSYSRLTPRLEDLAAYTWRVVPVDAAGNDGTVLAIDAETIVRTPDAPDFTITLNSGPMTVTFAEAA